MKTIDPSHRLPCDFIVGPLRFRKGVKLETVRAAAERWYVLAASTFPFDLKKVGEINKLIDGINDDNRHPETKF